MRLNAFLLASCLLAVALSGCADEPAEPEPSETDDLNSKDVALNTPPIADLRADLINGTAPMNVTFTLEGSDDDDDNLTWTFDAGDGNTTANGTSLPAAVNATYGVGNWTATFSVSDGKNTTVTTLLVAVAEGAEVPAGPSLPIVVGIEDASGDSTFPSTDILTVDYEVTETRIIAVMHMDLMLPHDVGDSPFLYQFHIDGIELEAYILEGAGVWNNDANEGADATVTWDAGASTVTIDVARSYVDGHGASFPYEVFNRAMIGEGQMGGLQEDDRAPDADAIVLGP